MNMHFRHKFAVDALIQASRNFHAFSSVVAQGDAQSKGKAFERLNQLYLQAAPEYPALFKAVWLWDEVPPHVKKALTLPNRDLGIDLVAETVSGEYWAVQCKFRTHSEVALTFQDLSTFVALSHVKPFAHRIIAHTSDKRIVSRDVMGDTAILGREMFLNIDAETWTDIQSLAKTGIVPTLTPWEPKPWQEPAITAAVAHFSMHDRGRLIMPCGTGKSLTSFFIANAIDARSVLIAVPSLSLMRQTLGVWTRQYLARGIAPDWMCVCSDESVAKADERDDTPLEVRDLGIPVISDVDEIAAALATPNSGHRIVFTTYHSSPKVAEAARQADASFDLSVLDEAHQTVGAKSRTFATLLHADRIAIKHRLFMTATERILNGENDRVLSMDDETVYGQCFFRVTFKEAIAHGAACDYKVITLTVSEAHIQQIIEDNRLLDHSPDEKPFEAIDVAGGVALRHGFEHHGIKHAISFHTSEWMGSLAAQGSAAQMPGWLASGEAG